MTLTETTHAGGFILSLANGKRSFQNIVVAEGENLTAGTVLALAGDKYVQLDPADASGGTDAPAAILFAATDASDDDQPAAAVVRDAEVIGAELVWPTGISEQDRDDAVAALAALGVIVR